MTRLICVTSGKGGVGKTTLVSNLSTVLSNLGHDVTAVDANLTTPNLSLHLGLHLSPRTLHNVLRGEAKLSSAVYPHSFGFKVLPASLSVNDLQKVDPARLSSVTLGFYGSTDFVIMDSAAGLGREAISAMQAADEILMITNPDLPSVADALKTVKVLERMDKKILGVVVNRVSKKWYETSSYEIEKVLGHPVVAEIPEDKNVGKSISIKMPVVLLEPNSPASVEFNRLGHLLAGKKFSYNKPRSFRILDHFVNWMTR